MTTSTKFKIQKIRKFEALIFCLEILCAQHQTLHNDFQDIEVIDNKITDKGTSHLYLNLSKCWSIIDYTERARKLLESTPGIHKKDTPVKEFIEDAQKLEQHRHYLQHLDRTAKNVDNNAPVFGGLSWRDHNDKGICHSVIFESAIKGYTMPSLIYDRVEDEFIHKVCLYTNNHHIDFDSHEVFAEELLQHIKKNPHKDPELAVTKMGLKFNIVSLSLNK